MTATPRRFHQVDVFSAVPLQGNPLAVVHDAVGVDDARLAAIARWTNLSETTFLLPPTDPAADYRVRIFTPFGELPFAGHPTLGSAWAWLAAGGVARGAHEVVQECGVGLVRVKRDGARLAFAAPPLRRSGPLDDALLARIEAGLGLAPGEIVRHAWVDNTKMLEPAFFQAIELVADRNTKRPFEAERKLFMKIRQKAFDNGLICYPVGGNVDGINGDVVILAPPYNVTESELTEIVDKTATSIRQVLSAEGLG